MPRPQRSRAARLAARFDVDDSDSDSDGREDTAAAALDTNPTAVAAAQLNAEADAAAAAAVRRAKAAPSLEAAASSRSPRRSSSHAGAASPSTSASARVAPSPAKARAASPERKARRTSSHKRATSTGRSAAKPSRERTTTGTARKPPSRDPKTPSKSGTRTRAGVTGGGSGAHRRGAAGRARERSTSSGGSSDDGDLASPQDDLHPRRGKPAALSRPSSKGSGTRKTFADAYPARTASGGELLKRDSDTDDDGSGGGLPMPEDAASKEANEFYKDVDYVVPDIPLPHRPDNRKSPRAASDMGRGRFAGAGGDDDDVGYGGRRGDTEPASPSGEGAQLGSPPKYVPMSPPRPDPVARPLHKAPLPSKQQTKAGVILPLHQAIDDESPFELIEHSVARRPDDLRKQNDRGDMPLHVALKRMSAVETIQVLANAFPQAALEPVRLRVPALQYAIETDLASAAVVALVKACPDAARELTNGGDAMLQLAIDTQVSAEVLVAVMDAYPAALNELRDPPIVVAAALCSFAPAAVQCMLRHLPALVTQVDENGRSLLHFAAAHEICEDLALRLLEENPDAAQNMSKDAQHVLHAACAGSATPRVVSAVLGANKRAAARKWKMSTPLHLLLRRSGELHAVTDVLMAYPDAVKETDGHGCFPLHYGVQATTAGQLVSQINFMIARYDLAATRLTRSGVYALHLALEASPPETIIEKLLDANPGAAQHRWPDGPLPVYAAVRDGKSKRTIAALAVAYPAGLMSQEYLEACPLPLHRAIAQPGVPESVVLTVLNLAPEAAKVPVAGGTALHLALATKATLPVVKALLDTYSEAASLKHAGTSRRALSIALERKVQPAITIAVLQAYPTAVDWMLSTGDQVVMHCIRDGTHASVVVAMLKEYPAGAKEPDADGRLPLHVAIESHADSDIVAALVEAYPEAAVTKSPEGKWPKDMVLEPGVPAMTSTVVFDTIRASDD